MDGRELEIKALEAKSIELQALQREMGAQFIALMRQFDSLIETLYLQIIELSK